MSERVVITGPTGTVGMALIRKCIEEKAEVLVICHPDSPRNHIIPKSPLVTVLEADLQALGKIDYAAETGYNIFYHLAWTGTCGEGRNDTSIQAANIRYTLDAVDLAARLGCHTFVGAGSQEEYGRVEGVLKPDTPAFPETGYGIAKLCAGQMSRLLCGQKGMRHIWARILSVYGPYDRSDSMVSQCIFHMLHNEPTAFTPAEQIWDFLYCDDAADALWLLGHKGQNGKAYCLGSGQGVPLKRYIEQIKEITRYRMMPGIGSVPYAKGQVMELCADLAELTADTGFVPRTDFETGVRKTIEWMKQNEKN